MENNWNLYVVGKGAYDESLITTFVSSLRDLGLTISDVTVIDGHVHPNLMDTAPSGEGDMGWTLALYGEGDVTLAYAQFPGFLTAFREGGIEVLDSGIVTGERREIAIPTA